MPDCSASPVPVTLFPTTRRSFARVTPQFAAGVLTAVRLRRGGAGLVAILALAACSSPPPAPGPAAVPVASAAGVPDPGRPPTVSATPEASEDAAADAGGAGRTAVPNEAVARPSSPGPAAEAPARRGTAVPSMDSFVAAVQREIPAVAVDRRDDELADLGALACAAPAGDRSRAVADVAAAGVTVADAGALVDLARTTACRR